MIEIEVHGAPSAAKASRRFQVFGASVADLTDFWRDVYAPKFLADIQENFDSEGEMVGGWPPLAPWYAKWKAETWGAHLNILELSLRLRGSLQWIGRDIGPEGIFDPQPTYMVIGTSVPYARKHNEGIGNIPRRQFIFHREPSAYAKLWTGWLQARWQESHARS